MSLAGLAWYVWPIPPRWAIPCENFLGFNKEANVLYTYPVWYPAPVYALDSNDNKNTLELHGYGVATGNCELSKVFSFDVSHVKPEFKDCKLTRRLSVPVRMLRIRHRGLLLVNK